MRLQLTRSIDALLEKRLVFYSHVDTPKDGAWDTKSRLKVALIVDGWRTSNAEVVRQDRLRPAETSRRLLARRPTEEPQYRRRRAMHLARARRRNAMSTLKGVCTTADTSAPSFSASKAVVVEISSSSTCSASLKRGGEAGDGTT